MKQILIGIPVLNNTEITRACLFKLLKNTSIDSDQHHVTILIIDNGSSEDIAGFVQSEFSRSRFPVHYRRNPINLGVAIAWNQILKFSPDPIPGPDPYFDYYVVLNNDALVGQDWLRPMINIMENNKQVGWVSALENGSAAYQELIEAHDLSKRFRMNPDQPYTTDMILQNMDRIYAKWDGHHAFCETIKQKGNAAFLPFKGEERSAVCFMIRPKMIEHIGYFDEDFAPIGIAEDLEYFLRMEQVLPVPGSTFEIYSKDKKWLCGFSSKSLVHHNWCSTRQGPDFVGRGWDKTRKKHWQRKFGKSKKYFAKQLP